MELIELVGRFHMIRCNFRCGYKSTSVPPCTKQNTTKEMYVKLCDARSIPVQVGTI